MQDPNEATHCSASKLTTHLALLCGFGLLVTVHEKVKIASFCGSLTINMSCGVSQMLA
jgi:hypothetical protein